MRRVETRGGFRKALSGPVEAILGHPRACKAWGALGGTRQNPARCAIRSRRSEVSLTEACSIGADPQRLTRSVARVGVVPLAQLEADRHARQVEGLAQAV